MTKRTARRNFKREYGETTYEIVSRLAKGQSPSEVASTLAINHRSVATTAGNLTRGWYTPFVTPSGNGLCAF